MSEMNSNIQAALARFSAAKAIRSETLSGGSISRVSRILFEDGTRLVLKEVTQAPPDLFLTEAMSLEALRASKTLRIPGVIEAGSDFLLVEDLGKGDPSSDYWRRLGEGLAALHSQEAAAFGFFGDNYCGSTAQANPRLADGFEFFAQHRMMRLAKLALQRDLLGAEDLTALEQLADSLRNWIPNQKPVLIHGDLWSGNIHCMESGEPALIDPAAYWGWAEAELAMTTLFGGFDSEFYESYAANSSMAADWQERAELYNLYHLLNHLLLFGGSYLPRIKETLRRYS